MKGVYLLLGRDDGRRRGRRNTERVGGSALWRVGGSEAAVLCVGVERRRGVGPLVVRHGNHGSVLLLPICAKRATSQLHGVSPTSTARAKVCRHALDHGP